MMPKMSVNPEATRNSSNPYWRALRHWTRNVATSMRGRRGRASSHLAAAARVGERLGGDADHLVLLADHLAQVDVLHRIVARADGEGAARAVDLPGLDRLWEVRLAGAVALGRLQTNGEHPPPRLCLHPLAGRLGLVGLLLIR